MCSHYMPGTVIGTFSPFTFSAILEGLTNTVEIRRDGGVRHSNNLFRITRLVKMVTGSWRVCLNQIVFFFKYLKMLAQVAIDSQVYRLHWVSKDIF